MNTFFLFYEIIIVTIMDAFQVDIATPDEYMGDIIGDVNSRRGQVTMMPLRA